MSGLFAIVPQVHVDLTVLPLSSVVVLEESPCPRGSSRTTFQVLVLESQVLHKNTGYLMLFFSVVFCLYFVIFLLLYDSIICGQFIFLLGRPVSEL